jgi:DNA-directed RNA polymerase specialized sigma24 family protein
MADEQTVTHWIGQLKGGDARAAQELWQRYFARLVALARQRLGGAARRAADEEDVALSAMDSFCRAAREGRFPRLDDRDDLWQLLVMLTMRKAADLAQREGRQKRGGGQVAAASELGAEGEARAFAEMISREPDPAFAAEVAEQCQRLLGALSDPALRQVALAKMAGHTNEEVAGLRGVSLPTVERKLQRIRSVWSARFEKE